MVKEGDSLHPRLLGFSAALCIVAKHSMPCLPRRWYTCSAQETRPKGQTLRVEQGVAVERAPPVRLRDTLGGGGAEPSPSGPSSAASAGRRGPSATGGGFGPWTTSAGAAGWGATSSAVGLGATGVAGAAAGDAKVPAFVEHAGRTLTFEAWYGESVAESAIESMRIRKVGSCIHVLEFVLLCAVVRSAVCMAAGRRRDMRQTGLRMR